MHILFDFFPKEPANLSSLVLSLASYGNWMTKKLDGEAAYVLAYLVNKALIEQKDK